MIDKIKKYLFVNTSLKQTIVKNTFWIALSTTLVKVARAGVIIYVARLLGAHEYGLFTYSMSLVGIFMIFSDLGLTNILIRELSHSSEKRSTYISTTLFVKAGFLLFTLALIASFGPLIAKFPEAKNLILVVGVFVAIESFRSFFYAIPRADSKMETEAGLSILAEVISIVIIIVLFLRTPSADGLARAYIVGNLLGLLTTIIFLRKNLSGIFGHFSRSLVRPILNSALPLALVGIFGVFMTHIDSVMLGFWYKPEVLGIYAAAQKPISLFYVLPSFLSASLFPVISRFVRQSRERLASFIGKSYRASMAIAMPIVAGGLVIAGPLIMATFGNEYSEAVTTFMILLVSLLVGFPGSMFADVILAEDRQKLFFRSSGFGALTNIVFNLILIPKYGIIGSAIATVVAQSVSNGMIYFMLARNERPKIFHGLGKIFMGTIVVAGVAFGLKSLFVPLVVIVPISALAYIGFLWIVRERLISDLRESFRD